MLYGVQIFQAGVVERKPGPLPQKSSEPARHRFTLGILMIWSALMLDAHLGRSEPSPVIRSQGFQVPLLKCLWHLRVWYEFP